MTARAWLTPLHGAGRGSEPRAVAVRVVCWPYAGGSAAALRPLAAALADAIAPGEPAGVEVLGVDLPGRAGRPDEALATDPDAAVATVVAELAARPVAERTVVLGHSMGAALAHRTTAALEDAGPVPALVVLSAWPPPEHVADPPGGRPAHEMENADLVAFAARLEAPGTDDLDDDDVREYLLPPLAADLRLADRVATTDRRRSPRLATPAVVVAAQDDPAFPPDDVLAWSEHLDVRLPVRLPGGHFAVLAERVTVAGAVAAGLARSGAGVR